jgi:hypothetical protein
MRVQLACNPDLSDSGIRESYFLVKDYFGILHNIVGKASIAQQYLVVGKLWLPLDYSMGATVYPVQEIFRYERTLFADT